MKDAPCPGQCLHGACINGTCVCPSGWSGNADLLTGDLTPWGGDVLDCTTHLLTMQILWSIILLLCIIAIVISPVAIYQQWQKYRRLRGNGRSFGWLQHRPLIFVLSHAVLVLVVFSMGMAKLITPHYRRLIGIDPYLSACVVILALIGGPLAYAFFMEVALTFTRGILSEMVPNSWSQKALGIARFLFILGGILVACTGLSMIAFLSVSPLSGRQVHVVCSRLVHWLRAAASFVTTVGSTICTAEILRDINHTLKERIVLAHWTRSPELRADVKALRRTRFKVAALQFTIITINVVNIGWQLWISSNSTRQQYASYLLAYEYISYMQVNLLVLQTYTSITWEDVQALRLRLLNRFLSRSTASPPSGTRDVADIEASPQPASAQNSALAARPSELQLALASRYEASPDTMASPAGAAVSVAVKVDSGRHEVIGGHSPLGVEESGKQKEPQEQSEPQEKSEPRQSEPQQSESQRQSAITLQQSQRDAARPQQQWDC